MISLNEIKEPVKHDLEKFDKYFKESFVVEDPYISKVLSFILSRSGKQMRPLLTLLSAALNGKVNHSSYVAATLVEIIHTASLIHDDVVDEAYHRRGEFSINALFRSKKSVLIGDFVLARGIKTVTNEEEFSILKSISTCLENLCEGELIQMEHTEMLDTTEDIYYEIIRKKTGVLLGACGEVGAKSVKADQRCVDNMREFGELLGIAFQIKDDILDFAETDITGKYACNDLFEQKITLPMIYLLNHSEQKTQKQIINLLSTIRKKPENAGVLRKMILESGGLDYADRCMRGLKDKAVALLSEYPETEVKKALINYANFVLDRKK